MAYKPFDRVIMAPL